MESNFMPNVHFNKGDVIFEEGYPADSVFLVCEGSVKIYKKSGGNNVEIATLNQDAIFGEMALISGRPRSATVIAAEDCWCYSINNFAFEEKLKTTDPVIVNIFDDLVETIRKKSNATAMANQSPNANNDPALELESFQASVRGEDEYESILPDHSPRYLMNDPELLTKIEKMDYFMKVLYDHLVDLACKE